MVQAKASFTAWFSVFAGLVSGFLTGGPVIAGIFVLSNLFKIQISSSVNTALIIAFIIFASYLVWEKERKRAVVLAKHLDRGGQVPAELAAEIQAALWPKKTLAGGTFSMPRTIISSVILVGSITYLLLTKPSGGTVFPPPPPEATPNVQGNWSGTYTCSKHGGTLEWKVKSADTGQIEVSETYHAKLPIVGVESGNVSYAGQWKNNILHLESANLGSYAVNLTLSADGKKLLGTYVGKPGCTTLSLHR